MLIQVVKESGDLPSANDGDGSVEYNNGKYFLDDPFSYIVRVITRGRGYVSWML